MVKQNSSASLWGGLSVFVLSLNWGAVAEARGAAEARTSLRLVVPEVCRADALSASAAQSSALGSVTALCNTNRAISLVINHGAFDEGVDAAFTFRGARITASPSGSTQIFSGVGPLRLNDTLSVTINGEQSQSVPFTLAGSGLALNSAPAPARSSVVAVSEGDNEPSDGESDALNAVASNGDAPQNARLLPVQSPSFIERLFGAS